METGFMNRIIGLVLALVVGGLLVGGLLIPSIEGMTATEKTFQNTGPFNYGIFTPDDDYTLEYTTADGSLIVNGEAVPAFDAMNKAYSIVASDNFVARFGENNTGYFCQCIGTDENNTVFADGGVTATIAITSGKLSVTWVKADSTTTTKTVSFDEMYAIVPTADAAILKVSTDEVYIKGDSEVYASGLTTVTQWHNIFHFEGTYEDGITITSPNLPTATYSNITWNIAPVDGYKDLYKLTSIEFDITYNDAVTHATYSYFGVPSSVTAELSQHMDATQIAMFGVISILGIVALVVVAANGIRNKY